MSQLDYYKLIRKFPEIIAMDGSTESKKEIIEYSRKQTYRKEGIHALLPIDSSKLNHIELEKWSYEIRYRKELLFSIKKITSLCFNVNFVIIYPNQKTYKSYFMTRQEVQNYKRIAIIDSIL